MDTMKPNTEKDFPVLLEIPTLGWKVLDTLQGPCFRLPDGRHDWPTPRESQIIDAYNNERERLREAMLDAIDKLERTTSVQDRSVTLIKQSCRFIAKNLRAALNDQKGK